MTFDRLTFGLQFSLPVKRGEYVTLFASLSVKWGEYITLNKFGEYVTQTIPYMCLYEEAVTVKVFRKNVNLF